MKHFISDLHLCPQKTDAANAFVRYLNGPAREAKELWILGDLFEYWTGDEDAAHPFHQAIIAELASFTQLGTQVKIIVGNRDFLLGPAFAKAASIELIAEDSVTIEIDQCRQATVLHGDILCSDDHAYQQFRSMVRNPVWQKQFLAQPIAIRHKLAADLRAKSEMGKQEKSAEIMDVNADTVAQFIRQQKVCCIIHGHTHRPQHHTFAVDGQNCERWVLADWHDQASWLEVTNTHISAKSE